MAEKFNDNSDLISIVVPIYNAEKYLASCLDSVKNQVYGNYEVILVNDGSTDSSVDICQRFCTSDPRFKLFHKSNGGQSSARNLGIEVCNGEWIFFLDADDELYPNSLLRLKEMQREFNSDVAIAAWVFAKSRPQQQGCGEPVMMSPETAIEKALYQKILVNVTAAIYRRNLFNDVRFVDGQYYEDLQIFYRLFDRANSITYSPEVVCFYRDTDGSFSNTFARRRLDALKVTDEIVDYMKEKHPALLPAALDRRFSAHFNILNLIWSTPGAKEVLTPELYESTEKRCLNVIREQRLAELSDSNVRLKNKLGALLSFLPVMVLKPLVKILSKS